MQPTESPRDPVNQLAPKEPGAPAADDHDRMGPPAPEVIARGYEADVYDAKSVISVPLLVVLFFVLAFGTVTVIFRFIAYPPPDARAHPAAAERNKRPLNDRLAGISRSKEGDQPRLEPLRLRESGDLKDKYGRPLDQSRAITRPELPKGNSPEIHPEDLRATKESFPELFRTGANALGVDKSLALSDDQLKVVFKVQTAGAKPLPSQHYPTAANAGRGAEESVVEVPVAPGSEPKKDATPKKDEPKKPDPPTPDPKKAPEPKPEEKKK